MLPLAALQALGLIEMFRIALSLLILQKESDFTDLKSLAEQDFTKWLDMFMNCVMQPLI